MKQSAAGLPLQPIHTNHLFRPLARELIKLLRTITPDRFGAKTCYPTWTVHDIATHLIQTAVGRLSAQRDGYRPTASGRQARGEEPSGARQPPGDFEGLSEYIDAANTRWQETLRGVSPRVVTEILAYTETALARYLASLPRRGKAPISVAWAGEAESEHWFDTARELTERWHHQQQIREAVEAPGIDRPAYLRPVIRTLIRALPYWYEPIRASEGTTVRVEVGGPSGGCWELVASTSGWSLLECAGGKRTAAANGHQGGPGGSQASDATVLLSEDTAWRFLTRSISEERARPLITVSGDRELGERFLSVVAVMIPAELR